jgi:hypothetical protein
MARTISQAERIEGERQHGTAAPAPVVDRYYRLQPSDLGGVDAPPRTVVVRLVGVQGFEEPLPLLHLTGLVKPLLLDAANVAAITRIAASPLQRDWAGREVVLAVVRENGAPVIRLFAPGDPAVADLRRRSQVAARTRALAARLRRALRYSLVLLGVTLVAAAALYLFENWATLLELAVTLIDGFLALR